LNDDVSVDGQSGVDAHSDTDDVEEVSCNPPQIEPTVPFEQACGFIDSYACYDGREYRCAGREETGDGSSGLIPTGRDCCHTPIADMGVVDFSAETISYRGPRPTDAEQWRDQCTWEPAPSRELQWKIRFRGTIANRGNRATRVRCWISQCTDTLDNCSGESVSEAMGHHYNITSALELAPFFEVTLEGGREYAFDVTYTERNIACVQTVILSCNRDPADHPTSYASVDPYSEKCDLIETEDGYTCANEPWAWAFTEITAVPPPEEL
jgi:hypothetical protein